MSKHRPTEFPPELWVKFLNFCGTTSPAVILEKLIQPKAKVPDKPADNKFPPDINKDLQAKFEALEKQYNDVLQKNIKLEKKLKKFKSDIEE